MMIFIEVLLDRTTRHVFDAIKAAVKAHPKIIAGHRVAGAYND
jgi:Lrp/AsnC family leucine-responsive transcriptional regulator